MFELTVNIHFDAAHFLRGYQGKCAQIHGHTWRVQVKVRGQQLDQIGMLIDFSLLKSKLREITDDFDHVLLNDLDCFSQVNPTAECISKYIFDRYCESLRKYNVQVCYVQVWESSGAAAAYFEDYKGLL